MCRGFCTLQLRLSLSRMQPPMHAQRAAHFDAHCKIISSAPTAAVEIYERVAVFFRGEAGNWNQP